MLTIDSIIQILVHYNTHHLNVREQGLQRESSNKKSGLISERPPNFLIETLENIIYRYYDKAICGDTNRGEGKQQ